MSVTQLVCCGKLSLIATFKRAMRMVSDWLNNDFLFDFSLVCVSATQLLGELGVENAKHAVVHLLPVHLGSFCATHHHHRFLHNHHPSHPEGKFLQLVAFNAKWIAWSDLHLLWRGVSLGYVSIETTRICAHSSHLMIPFEWVGIGTEHVLLRMGLVPP